MNVELYDAPPKIVLFAYYGNNTMLLKCKELFRSCIYNNMVIVFCAVSCMISPIKGEGVQSRCFLMKGKGQG